MFRFSWKEKGISWNGIREGSANRETTVPLGIYHPLLYQALPVSSQVDFVIWRQGIGTGVVILRAYPMDLKLHQLPH